MAEEPNRRLGGSLERIGRYRILSRLGKGAMGVVYRARDDQMERDVALKVLMTDAESDDGARERFFREARITGKLIHRNIVTVFNMGEEDGRHFIVMELLQGGTLTEWLKDPTRVIEQKLDLMIQTCDGLAVAHAAGVVHRDVKPSNLFVQPDGSLKILDFGVARLASSNMTRSGFIVGTPDYMSPEQARGKEVDLRSDIFSAAAVFYFMLTGRKPFEGGDLPAVLNRVVNDDPLPLRDDEAAPTLARIVVRGLQKAAELRYQTVPELATDLARFKRQFEAETRQLVAAARSRYDQLSEQVASIADLRARAELPASPAIEAQAALVDRYPSVRTSPAAGMAALSWSRKQVGELSHAIAETGRAVSAELESLRTGVGALEAAEEALEHGNGLTALKQLQVAEQHLGRAVRRYEAASTRALAIVADQQAREDHLQALLGEARAAAKAGNWDIAEQRASDVLQLHADVAEAKTILTKAQAALNAERDARVKRHQRLRDQAETALRIGQFDQAERALREAQQVDPQNADLGPLSRRLEEARADAAARDEASRKAAAAIAAARNTFGNGQHDAAVVELESFLRVNPNATGVGIEIQRLRTEATRLAQEAARRAEAQTLAAEAEGQWNRGEIDAALASATRALQLDASHGLAKRVQAQVQTRLKELADAAKRRKQADALLRVAVGHLAKGRFDRAAAEAQQVLDLQADRVDAGGVLADAQRLAADEAAEQERIDAARGRARQIGKLLRESRVCLHTGDYARAVWTAENAFRLNPSHPGAALRLGQARAALAATRIVGTDDTVRMNNATGESTTSRRRYPPAILKIIVLWATVIDWAGDVRRTWQATRWGRS